MNEFTHRGVSISISEGPSFTGDGYTVNGRGRTVYKAEFKTEDGTCVSLGLNGDEALKGAKRQVDCNLDGRPFARVSFPVDDNWAAEVEPPAEMALIRFSDLDLANEVGKDQFSIMMAEATEKAGGGERAGEGTPEDGAEAATSDDEEED